MYLLCAILVVIGLALVDCNNGNMTERWLADKFVQKYDLQYPDFFVIGAMKCGTTSLSKVSLLIRHYSHIHVYYVSDAFSFLYFHT